MTMLSPATPDTTVGALSADGYSVITKDVLSEQLLQIGSTYDSVEKVLSHIKSRLGEWGWGTESGSISILASLDALIQENANVDVSKSQDGSIVVAHEKELAFSPDVLRTIYDDLSNYQHDLYTNLSEQSNHIPLSTLYHLITQRESHRGGIGGHIMIGAMQEVANIILAYMASSVIDISTVTDKYIPRLLRMYHESNPDTAATVIQTLNRVYEDMRMSHEVDQSVLAKIDAMRDVFLGAIPRDTLLLRFAQSALAELASSGANIASKQAVYDRIIAVYYRIRDRQPDFLALFLPHLQGEMWSRILTNESAKKCRKLLQLWYKDNPLIAEMSGSYDCLKGKYMTDFLYGWQRGKKKKQGMIQTIHTALHVAIEEHKKLKIQDPDLSSLLVGIATQSDYHKQMVENPYLSSLLAEIKKAEEEAAAKVKAAAAAAKRQAEEEALAKADAERKAKREELEKERAYREAYLAGKKMIDDLLAVKNISKEVEEQLLYIRGNVHVMLAAGFDISLITLEDKTLVINGQRFYSRDKQIRKQTYKEMRDDPKNKTYPQYAESLFEMLGAMIGKKFEFPSNRGQIQDATVDGQTMIYALNSANNREILGEMKRMIGGPYRSIPLGIDNEGYVIYASCIYNNSDYCRFDRNDSDKEDCLVRPALS